MNLAIGFHILVFLSAIYLPKILKPSIKYPEIYSVKLVNIAESQPESMPAAPKVKQPEIVEPEVKEIKIKPVEIDKPPVVVKPKPRLKPRKKAISIKPLKRQKRKKKIKKIVKAPPPDRTIERELKKARELEKQAEREAQLAAQQVEKIKRQIKKSNQANRGSQANISNLLESRYQAQIFSKLQQYWSLPDHKAWDPNLSALVVITIQIDGQVTNRYFEKKSGDRYFDQFVISTLEKAGNMPPIPPALKRRNYKIGLRFKPESIQ